MSSNRYTIGELARATGTKAVTIRYYENQGLVPSPLRSRNGYRQYGEIDRDRLCFIKRSRRLGFSLGDIRNLLELADRGNAPCDEVDAKVAQQLVEVRERIKQLQELERELKQLGASCEGGGIIDTCRIVEALSARKL